MAKFEVCQPNASGPNGAVFVVGQVVELDSIPGYLTNKVRPFSGTLEIASPPSDISVDDDQEERDLRDEYFSLTGSHAGGRAKKSTLRKMIARVKEAQSDGI